MAGALTSLPSHYEPMFDSNWKQNMAQQTDHVLAGTYQIEQVNGFEKRFDFMGAQNYAMRQVTARAQKSEPSDVPMFQRWVRVRAYDKTTWVDQFDDVLLGTLPNPDSSIAMNHAVAAMRQKDIILYNALLGTNYTGAQGTTAVTLPAANIIGVQFGSSGSNSGLQLAKLTQASFVMDSNNVQRGDRFLSYSAKQLNNLLTNVDQVNSVLYNDVRALRDGDIRDFMGFKFKMSQLVPFVSGSTTVRSCVAWQKKFLTLGMGRDVATKMDILPMQSQAIQIYTAMLLDGTRNQEQGVVEIDCDESV